MAHGPGIGEINVNSLVLVELFLSFQVEFTSI
jgi:hypothetical protein